MDEILTVAGAGKIGWVQPLVSIVIPTYNHLNLLKKCLDSIQEYTDLAMVEVVVIANGCTDGTAEYLRNMPWSIRFRIFDEPLGYTKATNEGIKIASGKYVILLNNDTEILPQTRNQWIELLLAPFQADKKTGVTGPWKFHWTVGETNRTALAFWCVMIPSALFTELGLLDEIFSPGMGEDGDFCIKAEEAGYRIVQVPRDGTHEFGKGDRGQAPQLFPIWHQGSATFGEKDYSAVSKRNAEILRTRYGKPKHARKEPQSGVQLAAQVGIEAVYQQILHHPCDVDQLFPTLRRYASECQHVTEFGVRDVVTTWAFLAARPKRMVSYDITRSVNIDGALGSARAAGIDFEFHCQDTLTADIEPTEMLFIDTKHTYRQLWGELGRHQAKVSKYILIHDTESFGVKGEDGGPGELQAIEEFLKANPDWKQIEQLTISNGLTVLGRKRPKVSIVIPTCGKDWPTVLKACVEAVATWTDWADKELIIVANGCPASALEYLRSRGGVFPGKFTSLEYPKPLGYIGAVNAGIHYALGEFVVLLDDDSILMGQPKDQWIDTMMAPFKSDPKMGATGPFGSSYPDLGPVLHSGCTMYKASVLRELHNFDEAFNPGYMGDEDLALRIRKAGYKILQVPADAPPKYVDGTFQLNFPVVHMGTVHTMPKDTTDLPLVKKNRDLLYERHGNVIRGMDVATQWQKDETAVVVVGGPIGCDPGARGPLGKPGLLAAYEEKLRMPKVSIIIPTYKNNFYTDPQTGERWNILKKNLETIAQYTDLSMVEVIVVCNGCVDGQAAYVNALGAPFRAIDFPDALGYTRATNEGIKVAKGEFLVFYNDDVVLLPQSKNLWLNWLLEPFQGNPKMGITGPLQLHDDYADQDVIIGFCLCIKKSVLDEIGGLYDEIYSPGGGEDIDICCKARAKGYVVRQVPKEGKLGYSHTNTGEYPIWHVNNQTFKDIEEYTRWYVKRNGLINLKRYNKNVRLNLGSGGIEHAGYLSVDLHDRRATIIMDITNPDFPENSVADIMAIHVFEHLSPYKAADILKSWHRILKPGGRLLMEMPDIEQLCKRFAAASTGERYGILNAVYGSVNTTGEGEPSDITSPHLFGWWAQSLWDHLTNAGFVNITFGPEQFPHPESNLHVEATKP